MTSVQILAKSMLTDSAGHFCYRWGRESFWSAESIPDRRVLPCGQHAASSTKNTYGSIAPNSTEGEGTELTRLIEAVETVCLRPIYHRHYAFN